MEVEISPPKSDFPEYSPFLLLSYRILSYFSWERTFDHPRQRLLEAVVGGLHLSTLAIQNILNDAIATFSTHFFDTLTSIVPLFVQLALTLPQSLRLTMFPQSKSESDSQSLYFIPLPTFPLASASDSLSESFKNIFMYMPTNHLLIWTQPTLPFTSPNFPHITLSIYLNLLGQPFTISDAAKQRTSQNARPIVIKLLALLAECNSPQDTPHLPPTFLLNIISPILLPFRSMTHRLVFISSL